MLQVKEIFLFLYATAWKVSVFGVFLVHIFPHSNGIITSNAKKYRSEKLRIRTLFIQSEYLCVFSPNAGKYAPEKLRIRTLFMSVCADVTRDVQIKDVDTHSHLKIYCQKTTVVLINSKWHDQIVKPKLRLINDWRYKLKSCSICNFDGVFLEIYFGLEISLTQEVQIHKRVRTEKPLNTIFLSKPLDHNRFYWKLFFLFLWNL